MKRPIGGFFGGTALRAGSSSIGVSVAPGATTLTVMPRGASSMAQDRASPTRAALLAAYWLPPAAPAAGPAADQHDPPAIRHGGRQRIGQLRRRLHMKPPQERTRVGI